ncbi:MAG: mevalonate kinase [Bacteroidetes bacterium]|nr:mevalonate kinase [Flavobacteriaceae bacterium]MDA0885808.1 mevalonate kinase [Bacteroidota bacterium]
MDNKKFYSKILLFGEYGVISNSNALSIPFEKFYGYLNKSDFLNNEEKISNSNILELYEFITDTEIKEIIDLNFLKNDLDKGLHFVSSIPIGSGLGSSGALVASVFDSYYKKDIVNLNLEEIKNLLSIIESKFHGNSSGLDPSVSLFNSPIFYSNKQIKLIDKIHHKNFKVYIMDSKVNSSTKKMIEVFHNKMNESEFRNFFDNKYITNTNKCIEHLLNSSDLFRGSLKKLSVNTFNNFKEMIPNQLIDIWEDGFKSDSYYMKLCGSGGGGFFLVFDFNDQINSSFSNFKLFQI